MLTLYPAYKVLQRLLLLLIFSFSFAGQAQSPRLNQKIKRLWAAVDTVGPSDQVQVLNSIAKLYSSFSIDSSKLTLNRALDLARINNLDTGMANVHNSLGILNYMTGVLDSSIFHYTKSLEINKRLNYQRGIARNFSNLANVYYAQGDAFTAL